MERRANGANGLPDRASRMDEFFSAGSRLAWLIEPGARVVHVHRSRHDVQATGDGGELTGSEVLPGFGVRYAACFLTETRRVRVSF